MMRGLVLVAGMVGCYSPAPPTGAACGGGIACPAGLVCSPATGTCEVAAVDAAVPDTARDAPADAPPPDAPASPFAYRRRLAIENAASTTLPAGFTVRVPLGAALAALVAQGKVEPDFSDLRVIGDTAGERDRIVDPEPGAISFALAAPLAPGEATSDYALYYGSPSAGAPPDDGTAVFALYDDFTAGISSAWLINDAPVTSQGKLVLRAGRTDALTTRADADAVPIVSAVEVRARVLDPLSDPTPQPEGTFFYWFGYQRTGDFEATDPWVVWIARGKGQVQAEQKSPVGCEDDCEGPSAPQSTQLRTYAIERDPDETRFYLDGALGFTASVGNAADYAVIARNYMATSDVEIDWIRARARVSPDPVVSLGPEEAP